MNQKQPNDRKGFADRLCVSFNEWTAQFKGATPEADQEAYRAHCSACGMIHTLPRSPASIHAARALMSELTEHGAPTKTPKMYGVLVGQNAEGQRVVLKAYSGMIEHRRDLDGWVPAPSLPPSLIAEERRAITTLDGLRTQLFDVGQTIQSTKGALTQLAQVYTPQIEDLKRHIKAERADRHRRRAQLKQSGGDVAFELDRLNQDSETLNRSLQRLKDEYRDARHPLELNLGLQMDAQRKLRSRRKEVSRALQTKMHLAFQLTNFRGAHHRPIEAADFQAAPPSGTGECSAPKLLNFAAQHGIRPTGLAEFWWNPDDLESGKAHGTYYGPCAERCQPIMSHLLCGLDEMTPFVPSGSTPQGHLTVVYEDSWVIVINKPAGLLSVPGRRLLTADNVVTRLTAASDGAVQFKTAHRLDMATSGLLLVAKDAGAHQQLSKQFAARSVHKTYLAVLSRRPRLSRGLIELPLGTTRLTRPMTIVDHQHGKPSTTRFHIVRDTHLGPLVQFEPVTGRTHQLRVHASSPEGLSAPILGDSLYGGASHHRLCLHAAQLQFDHPISGERLTFQSDPDFE
ncbi:MAG: pseudouridine synthase [Myxococcota bacterium]|nr:pseudouridine synthase [Myxococcota bacterium]